MTARDHLLSAALNLPLWEEQEEGRREEQTMQHDVSMGIVKKSARKYRRETRKWLSLEEKSQEPLHYWTSHKHMSSARNLSKMA